jgi:hypothetical protein
MYANIAAGSDTTSSFEMTPEKTTVSPTKDDLRELYDQSQVEANAQMAQMQSQMSTAMQEAHLREVEIKEQIKASFEAKFMHIQIAHRAELERQRFEAEEMNASAQMQLRSLHCRNGPH